MENVASKNQNNNHGIGFETWSFPERWGFLSDRMEELNRERDKYSDKRRTLLLEGRHDQVEYLENQILPRLDQQYLGLLAKMKDTLANKNTASVPTPTVGAGITSSPAPAVDELRPSDNLFSTIDDLFRQEFPPNRWLVDKLIPESGLVALSGIPGSYKSWITQHIAIAVATGAKVFGTFDTTPGPILIIDRENSPRDVQERLKRLGADSQLPIHFLWADFTVEDEYLVERTIEKVKSNQVKLVILDSLVRVHRQNENEASGMAQVFGKIKLIQQAGAAVIFTHHHRKQSFMVRNAPSESLRGSSDILAAVDCHLAVDVIDKGIKITQSKLRQAQAMKPFIITFSQEDEHCRFTFRGEVEPEKEKIDLAKAAILGTLEEGESSRQDLIKRFQGTFGSSTIDDALKGLVSEGVSFRPGQHGRKIFYLTDSIENLDSGESASQLHADIY